ARGIRVDRTIADGEMAYAGRRRLRAVFTPGHTEGHHAFAEDTTGFVLAGDMVAGTGTVVVDPDEGDMAEYLLSIARLEAPRPRATPPAQGRTAPGPRAKPAEPRKHRLWREAKIIAALAKIGDGTAADIVRVAYDDVPESVHPLAERSLLAHLKKL